LEAALAAPTGDGGGGGSAGGSDARDAASGALRDGIVVPCVH